MGKGSQARRTAPEPMLWALGKEQVKCKDNPVSKNIPMTLSNTQLLAVGEQAAGWGGWRGTLGSVGRNSTETTEINRGGEWAGVPPTGPVPQEDRALPDHLPHPLKPPCLAPQCCGTDTKHPADRL